MKKALLPVFSLFSIYAIAQHDIVWEKSIGGEQAEYLYNAIQTPDYGFIILGSSGSDLSKTQNNSSKGDLDYFISKIDENGKQEWHTLLVAQEMIFFMLLFPHQMEEYY
ncbi:hypothetical protein [Empedobacter brevis]|uniref:hypothetical protein n=1 Tax=Empedobacter brevis TaxID=247 RepID=UPI00333F3CFE